MFLTKTPRCWSYLNEGYRSLRHFQLSGQNALNGDAVSQSAQKVGSGIGWRFLERGLDSSCGGVDTKVGFRFNKRVLETPTTRHA